MKKLFGVVVFLLSKMSILLGERPLAILVEGESQNISLKLDSTMIIVMLFYSQFLFAQLGSVHVNHFRVCIHESFEPCYRGGD